MPADSVSGESSLPGSEMAMLSLCPHKMEGAREPSGASVIRALPLFMKAPPSRPDYLIIRGLTSFWEDTNI